MASTRRPCRGGSVARGAGRVNTHKCRLLELLKAEGFVSEVSPAGQDGDVDLLAREG
jgi:hypothetical protein